MHKTCDLHTHSIFSDGTYTPTQLIDEAVGIGLSALALTDHNSVDGLPELISAAVDKPIEIVAGAEFSVDYNGTELHLLGLFIPQVYFSQVTDRMTAYNQRKEQSNIDLIASLRRTGMVLDYDAIKNATPNRRINRAHIAAAMLQKGYVGSVAEAFETYLSKTSGYYREPRRLTVWEMLDFIRSIGAVSVLAHPFLQMSEYELCHFLPLARDGGLVGMECYYVSYDEATTDISLRMADEIGLLRSGGSDFHGTRKPGISLGCGKGNLKIPHAWYLELKRKAK